ncbi:MAG: carboxypeptidase-like regulatory domain-containing protein, partial [Polyangiaceae bacterium]|nr:carboxypeptidase-like regulatory domain-containing protein [Polyangiaceae bacterium]
MAQENSTANASGVAARRTDGRRVSPAAAIAALAVVCVAGCASSSDSKFKAGARASDSSSSAKELDGGGAGASFGGGGGLNTLPDGGFADLDAAGAQIMCPQGVGAECNDQNCGNGTTTVITGRVLDPAAKNPVWNATVFVRDLSIPLPDLNGETLACGCGSYYPADVLGYAQTDANGAFTINSAPYGTNIDLVVQVGKWRMEYAPYTITRCATNTVPDLRLPRDSTEGTLPDIAISTGLSDSLECLPLRMGVSPSEYVGGGGGPGSTGHIHIFHGYGGANTDPPGPDSVQGLWDSTADLDKHDVVLLSCEGHETTGGGSAAMGGGGGAMTNQYQQILMDYANKGGRVFASHYQYAWFTQPRAEKTAAAFAAANLATWQGADGTSEELDDTVSFGTDIDTTLAGGG